MTDAETPAFTRAEIDHWAQDFARNLPELPTGAEVLMAKGARSFAAAASPTGFFLRVKLDDDDPVTLRINPVAACFLAKLLIEGGTNCGWMDPRMNPAIPLTAKHDP